MSHHETNCLMNLIETGPCKTPTFPPSANGSSRLNQNVYREAFSNAPRQKISLLPQCPHSTLWIALLSRLLPRERLIVIGLSSLECKDYLLYSSEDMEETLPCSRCPINVCMTDYMNIVIIEFFWLNNRNEGYPSINARHMYGNTHTHTQNLWDEKKRVRTYFITQCLWLWPRSPI